MTDAPPEQARFAKADEDLEMASDLGYVLDTFPIIRREDEAQFDGRYRPRDLVPTYMTALGSGDTETGVSR